MRAIMTRRLDQDIDAMNEHSAPSALTHVHGAADPHIPTTDGHRRMNSVTNWTVFSKSSSRITLHGAWM